MPDKQNEQPYNGYAADLVAKTRIDHLENQIDALTHAIETLSRKIDRMASPRDGIIAVHETNCRGIRRLELAVVVLISNGVGAGSMYAALELLGKLGG